MLLDFDPAVENRIMVCITPQKSCERLIKKGAERARETKGEFCVVYVNKTNDVSKDLKENTILLDLFNEAQKYGGRVSIIVGKNIPETLAEFAKKNNVKEIIVGKSSRTFLEVITKGDIVNPLKRIVEKNDIVVHVIE